jgi:hypothetical protein
VAIQVSNKLLLRILPSGTIDIVEILLTVPLVILGGYVAIELVELIGLVSYFSMTILFHSDPLNIIATFDMYNISLSNSVMFAVTGVIISSNIVIISNLLYELIKLVIIKFP